MGGPAVTLVEGDLQAPAPLRVDDRNRGGQGREPGRDLAVPGVGDRERDPGLGTVGGPDPVPLLEGVALELEVVEEDEHVRGRHQAEEALPGQEGRLHQGDAGALHESPSAAKSVDREV